MFSSIRCARAAVLIAALIGFPACLGGEREDATFAPESPTYVCYLENGSPASDAEVLFFPIDHDPEFDLPGEVFRFRADGLGRFRPKGLLRSGIYAVQSSIEIGGSRYGAFRDSVTYSAGTRDLPADTLRPQGKIAGRVRIPAGADPNSYSISVLGTDWFFNPDHDGVFESPGLPQGRYRFVIRKRGDGFYAPDSGSFRVRMGRTDTLPDTLAPRYSGPPVPSDLEAGYDIATGIVRLRWPDAHWGRSSLYTVFRRRLRPTPEDSLVRIGSAADTEFRDTVLHIDAGSWFARELPDRDSVDYGYRYQIAIADSTGRIGPFSAPTEVEAPSPYFIRNDFKFSVANISWPNAGDVASPNDSILVKADFSNPTRTLSRAQWFQGDTNGKPILDSLFPQPKREGHLEIRAMAPSQGSGRIAWVVRAWDGTGWNLPGIAAMAVESDKPSVSAGPDTVVALGTRVMLHGSGRDSIGEIVKREWDIAGSGFRDVSSPDTAFDAPAQPGKIVCVFRVTDDDGNQAVDTMEVDVLDPIDIMPPISFRNVAPNLLPFRVEGGIIGHRSLAFAGKLWLLGGLSRVNGWDNLATVFSSSDGLTWQENDLATSFPIRIGHGAVVFKDRMWVLGGRLRTALDSSLPKDQRTFRWHACGEVWSSSDGKVWRRETATAFPELDGFATVVFKDRIWILGGMDANHQPGNGVWSTADGVTWTEASAAAPFGGLAGMAAVAYQGSILAMGGSIAGGNGVSTAIWKSEDGVTWTRWMENAPFKCTTGMEAVAYQDRLWIIGGSRQQYGYAESPRGEMDSLINKKVWRSPDGQRWHADDAPGALLRGGFSATIFGDKLWMLFGYGSGGGFAADGVTAE